MDKVLEAAWIVERIGGSLASPADLPLPEQLAAATVFMLAMAGLMLLRGLTRVPPARPAERVDLDEAA